MIPSIVLVGGLGTRLRTVSGDTPKPLVTIGNRPFLEYVLDTLVDAHVSSICLATSYRWRLFQEHFGENYRGVPILYSVEDEPLGTGGAVRKCFQENHFSTALVLNGDTLFKIALDALVNAHFSNESIVTLALRKVPDTSRYGSVTCGSDHRIVTFEEKGTPGPGLINGGIYVIDHSAFLCAGFPAKFSLEVDFLQRSAHSLHPLGVACDDYFIDIGIPEDFRRAEADLHSAS
jgi:D-glycero-alpha-D-manno-heptose 1-phosphate guanylyltransferase